ncbi:alpha/beta-hydrolase [Dissoconium aciculare CBS 342.82]|uniref:Alpha/beta-hydrolase n=1 Tax=Dissoconium aciculare CBS 342.82 TaxID=1314786 RepID=A0A6J3LYM7_9PEZI|nr:alpha/beta-hydrolase [Dissoconium aciculare CBS 342.82]KAF1820875.1 alpha/beta-hydrolase [Dissoconium aciculare CBS 342.82]
MPALTSSDVSTSDEDTRPRENGNDVSSHEYSRQSQKLAHLHPSAETDATGPTHAVEAKYVTQLDAVVELANGKRLPTVPLEEAEKLNTLRAQSQGLASPRPPRGPLRHGADGSVHGVSKAGASISVTEDDDAAEPALGDAPPVSHTNPLFPPLPLYGPPSILRTLQSWTFRISSAYLSLAFLLAIVIGAAVSAVPKVLKHVRRRAMLQNPKRRRPFYEEELKRKQERRAADKAWLRSGGEGSRTPSGEKGVPQDGEFIPTRGGPDRLVKDVAYYAQRVGLDSETYEVQTEDGFVIELWHIFNPRDYSQQQARARGMRGPKVFHTKPGDPDYGRSQPFAEGRKKYPVLMMHGLLQNAGAFCTTDDDSLAFYLAKSGYDVWLGNNRCGEVPRHTSLTYNDPRMWAWNIRQMGVMDLAALVSRVLAETGFPKLALIAHSQGTTQTFVALAKEQRPDLGDKISVFCALAPAVYAGPLIGKMYFRFMQLIGPAVFRLVFGIHSFIPIMMVAKSYVPAGLFGWLGYHVFSFLFGWYDTRWDQGLRDRMFQWAPVYVSAESMRWWLGRECFAQQRCILATRQTDSDPEIPIPRSVWKKKGGTEGTEALGPAST